MHVTMQLSWVMEANNTFSNRSSSRKLQCENMQKELQKSFCNTLNKSMQMPTAGSLLMVKSAISLDLCNVLCPDLIVETRSS